MTDDARTSDAGRASTDAPEAPLLAAPPGGAGAGGRPAGSEGATRGRTEGVLQRLGMAPESLPVALVVFLGGIGGGIAFPIIPILGVQLGLPALLVGWILSANRVTRLVANPAAGALIDRFGGARPLTIGLAIEAVATATYSLALHTSIPGWLLLVGRAVWGLGSAAIIVGGVTIALNASSVENRGRSTATVRLALSLGMPAGLLAGGLVAGYVSDDAAFLFATGVTMLAGALAWWTVPRTGGARPRRTGERERSPLLARLRHAALSVARADRRIQAVWLANMLVFFSVQGTLLATLVLLVHARGIQVAGLAEQPMAGALLAVMMLASAGVTLYLGAALDRIPSRTGLALPGVVSGAVGFALLALTRSPWLAVAGVMCLGLGMGGTSTPLLTLLGDLTPEEGRGHAVGYYQFFGDVGGSLGPIVGVELVTGIGFTVTYLAVAGLLLAEVPLLVALWRAERRLRREGGS